MKKDSKNIQKSNDDIFIKIPAPVGQETGNKDNQVYLKNQPVL